MKVGPGITDGEGAAAITREILRQVRRIEITTRGLVMLITSVEMSGSSSATFVA